MSLHTSTGRPTKAQQARFDQIKRYIGCIACRIRQLGYVAPEIHHLTDCGRRRGHDFVIGLCEYHHRGVSLYGHQHAVEIYGPSLAHGSKLFRAAFGSDDDLLAYQKKLLMEIHT
jgi:hypothetical protein